MFGWVGELATAFAQVGFEGLVLLTLLIVVVLLVRANTRATDNMTRMHSGMLEALDRSSDSHNSVTRVLGRIEGILRLDPEE